MNKELAERFGDRLGAPIIHEFSGGHVLRDDKGMRNDEESYSLFMLCPDQTYVREGIYTGPFAWAVAECEKRIPTLEWDPVEEEWR